MASNIHTYRPSQTDFAAGASSPVRHGSSASIDSSVYSAFSSSFIPSRTSTLTSNSSSIFAPDKEPNSKRSSRVLSRAAEMQRASPDPAETYGNVRRSLRPLPQVPNSSPSARTPSVRHNRSQTIGHEYSSAKKQPGFIHDSENHAECFSHENPLTKLAGSPPSQPPRHERTNSQPPILPAAITTPELETFQKSSTCHLRTLSKFAKDESDEFAMASAAPSVVGLQGRRLLKRADSVRHTREIDYLERPQVSAWARSNWMDKQRHFLQAYEYLCHIGEAKEWIEDVIKKPIPPIVQLEEALRDGITLADVVQILYPHRTLRIFRSPKLQYRHTDNIALFFRFLDEVELPDIFRFEMIDLYEKKNIPKVIHCIHALSWLLYKKGIVEFRIGNLVGQLQFEHHELEQTQKGLDKSGLPMPSFSGMGSSFGADPEPEPEPEPYETEDERIEREIHENEAIILDFQAQIRGAMTRLKLGVLIQGLWDSEEQIERLQAAIRGDWTRKVVDYRLGMQRFAVHVQSFIRGYLIRRKIQNHEVAQKLAEPTVLALQNIIRAAKCRNEIRFSKSRVCSEDSSITNIQAMIRGSLTRKIMYDQYEEAREFENQSKCLQAAIRGMITRSAFTNEVRALEELPCITSLQAAIRGMLFRREMIEGRRILVQQTAIEPFQAAIRGTIARLRLVQIQRTLTENAVVEPFQAIIRGMLARSVIIQQQHALLQQTSIEPLQAVIRGMFTRLSLAQKITALRETTGSIILLQSAIRGRITRKFLTESRQKLLKFEIQWIDLESAIRACKTRSELQALREQLKAISPSVVNIQSAIRGTISRARAEAVRDSLQDNEVSILFLHSSIRGFILRNHLIADRSSLLSGKSSIIQLQALSRAATTRVNVGGLLTELDSCTSEISSLQAFIRAMLVRQNIAHDLNDLDYSEDVILDLQSMIRGSLVRQRFREKQQYYHENMQKVIKVQSIARAKIQGEAYKSLTSGKNPPVGTVKGFVHLLNDSDFDFDEEIEFERLRKTVVQHVRQNEVADHYISQLDIKIALLVKNKITLDEVVKHQKYYGGHIGALLPNVDMSNKDPFDLKALNKTSRHKLEQYQELFFLLQTQPQYLSRIFRRLRELGTSEKEVERLKHLMMGLFGYAQKRREEYYLLKLLVRSAKEEIDASASPQDYARCNFFFNKLFGIYIKSPKDRKFMKDTLGHAIKDAIIDNPGLDLESDPIQIYRNAINNEELRTGRKSHRPLHASREEAIRDLETRETFIHHLQDIRDIADLIFLSLEDQINRMPFGVRYVAQQIYKALIIRFEDQDHGYLLQIMGQWVWRNYLRPGLVEPEKHGAIDRGLSQDQRRNLAEIAKVIGQIASGRLFGNENVYLQPLNTYVGESIQRLGALWASMIGVQDAEAYFDIDEFNDLYAKTKPTLYAKMSDILSIHQLVASHISCVGNRDDYLRELVRDLGSVKNNESELINVRNSEILLTLTPKMPNLDDSEAETRSLFMETKRCILYIIRVQTGANLLEIMVKPPSFEDQERWRTLVRDELSTNSHKRGAYSDTNALIDIGSMSYPQLKATALENILLLEKTGKISRSNQYQDLLNSIALDIRTKHRRRIQRQRELDGVRLTLSRLNDQAIYLEQQMKTYNDYIEQAMVTLQNKKGKKRFLMPFTKQWDHERELQRTGRHFKFGSYKYSARNLSDKGVLVYWKGYTEKQWDRVDLTISSNEVGVFTIDGSSGNMMVPGANAQVLLDDLLQAQYNNSQFMDFFEGYLRVNVNLFLHLIMRKFYNDSK